jgi:hypothetical protein
MHHMSPGFSVKVTAALMSVVLKGSRAWPAEAHFGQLHKERKLTVICRR